MFNPITIFKAYPFFLILFLLMSFPSLANDEMALILERYESTLLNTSIKNNNVDNYIKLFNSETGQWTDFDYQETDKAGWDLSSHIYRIKYIALAYRLTSSKYYRSKQLLDIITPALDHWFANNYVNRNWHPMEVSIPKALLDIAILIGPELDKNYQKILESTSKVRIYKSGVNLIWLADNVLIHSLLTNNPEKAAESISKIIQEIKVGAENGIQVDHSFFHHEERLQEFSYGGAYIELTSRLAWQLRGTTFSFPEAKVDVLSDFVTEGMRWMSRGKYTVPPTLDRAASRKDALARTISQETLDYLIDLNPEKAPIFSEMKKALNSPYVIGKEGTRFYHISDFLTHHTQDQSVFIKILSNRNLPTESSNNENLKGKYLNFGNTYFVKNGKEYYDFMPFWNWDLLPGFTHIEGTKNIQRNSFSGVVAVENIGLASMNYTLTDSQNQILLTAKKSWFTFKNIMLCLVSDLKNYTDYQSITALDQSRWTGWVNTSGKVLSEYSDFDLSKSGWVFHNGFIYGSNKAEKFGVRLSLQKSSWGDINIKYKNDKSKTEKVFLPYIMQKEGNFEYFVGSATTVEEAEKLYSNQFWTIDSNSSELQQITFENKLTLGVIWKKNHPIKVNDYTIESTEPIYFILEGNELTITNPSEEVKSFKIQINGKLFNITLDKIKGNKLIL
ncbi:polysaccharide lyase family 8 super-sandwich domain-containing protein [Echinicola sp. 20G]|uniref:polysaccharide lyase family 8 super-sandwich domain-containing protein n=1 Tax=Echinicola sp. 20G TaxID=2781961 RepID=UPI0019103D1A|nr:polysaccharide lyase family 8 super-sandwich domain-containing protein [Echinicola sp. 20G]